MCWTLGRPFVDYTTYKNVNQARVFFCHLSFCHHHWSFTPPHPHPNQMNTHQFRQCHHQSLCSFKTEWAARSWLSLFPSSKWGRRGNKAEVLVFLILTPFVSKPPLERNGASSGALGHLEIKGGEEEQKSAESKVKTANQRVVEVALYSLLRYPLSTYASCKCEQSQ